MAKKIQSESFTLVTPKLSNVFDLTSRFETLATAAISDIQELNERRNDLCKELTIRPTPRSPPPVVRKKAATAVPTEATTADAPPKPAKKQVTIKHRVFAKYATEAGPLCRAIAPVGGAKIRPLLYALQHTLLTSYLECGPKMTPDQVEHSTKYARRVIALSYELMDAYTEYPNMTRMNQCAGDIESNIRAYYEKLPEYSGINFKLFAHTVVSFMSSAAYNAASSFLHQVKEFKAYNVTIDDFINAGHYFNGFSDHVIDFEVILIKYTHEFIAVIAQDKAVKKAERERKQAEAALVAGKPLPTPKAVDPDYTAETDPESEGETDAEDDEAAAIAEIVIQNPQITFKAPEPAPATTTPAEPAKAPAARVRRPRVTAAPAAN